MKRTSYKPITKLNSFKLDYPKINNMIKKQFQLWWWKEKNKAKDAVLIKLMNRNLCKNWD